jgi:DNA-binding response OmpR family regulator
MTKEIKTDAKKYSLTGIETQLLKVTQQNFQTVLSNEMAMIAIQRLNYDVTPNTRFVFSDDMTEVAISEDDPKEDTGVIGE